MSSAGTSTKIETFIQTANLLSRMNRSQPGARESRTLYYRMLADYYNNIHRARQEGKLIAAHTVFFPTEVLYAMDIVPMHMETTTWLSAFLLKEQSELLAKGSELGLAPEICSPHRGVAGMFALQEIPKPDVILWSNLICDNTAKSGELLMELTGSPGYFLDNPFQDSPGELDYLIGELKEMVTFLEEVSGKKMNWEKLSEIIERTNKEIDLYREINELRKAVPSPMNISGYLELISADYLFPGQVQAIEYLTKLRDELKSSILNKEGAVTNERFRLMNLFIPPLHLLGSLVNIFDEQGAVSVAEPMFTRWSDGKLDPSKPLRSVAQKSFLIPERRSMYGPLKGPAIPDIVESAEQYQVDGAIYWAFMGCRHTCAAIKVIKEALNEIDVPMLTIDCDIIDPTVNSEDEVREQLMQFFEMLEDR